MKKAQPTYKCIIIANLVTASTNWGSVLFSNGVLFSREWPILAFLSRTFGVPKLTNIRYDHNYDIIPYIIRLECWNQGYALKKCTIYTELNLLVRGKSKLQKKIAGVIWFHRRSFNLISISVVSGNRRGILGRLPLFHGQQFKGRC